MVPSITIVKSEELVLFHLLPSAIFTYAGVNKGEEIKKEKITKLGI